MLWGKHNGTWKNNSFEYLHNIFAKHNGLWKNIEIAYLKANNLWKQILSRFIFWNKCENEEDFLNPIVGNSLSGYISGDGNPLAYNTSGGKWGNGIWNYGNSLAQPGDGSANVYYTKADLGNSQNLNTSRGAISIWCRLHVGGSMALAQNGGAWSIGNNINIFQDTNYHLLRVSNISHMFESFLNIGFNISGIQAEINETQRYRVVVSYFDGVQNNILLQQNIAHNSGHHHIMIFWDDEGLYDSSLLKVYRNNSLIFTGGGAQITHGLGNQQLFMQAIARRGRVGSAHYYGGAGIDNIQIYNTPDSLAQEQAIVDWCYNNEVPAIG